MIKCIFIPFYTTFSDKPKVLGPSGFVDDIRFLPCMWKIFTCGAVNRSNIVIDMALRDQHWFPVNTGNSQPLDLFRCFNFTQKICCCFFCLTDQHLIFHWRTTGNLPSGNLTYSYWKSPFLMGKYTTFLWSFSIATSQITRGYYPHIFPRTSAGRGHLWYSPLQLSDWSGPLLIGIWSLVEFGNSPEMGAPFGVKFHSGCIRSTV